MGAHAPSAWQYRSALPTNSKPCPHWTTARQPKVWQSAVTQPWGTSPGSPQERAEDTMKIDSSVFHVLTRMTVHKSGDYFSKHYSISCIMFKIISTEILPSNFHQVIDSPCRSLFLRFSIFRYAVLQKLLTPAHCPLPV